MKGSNQEIEPLLKAAVEHSPSGLLAVDDHGIIILVNKEVERIFGYSRKELLGNTVEMLVPEQFKPKHPDYRASYHAHSSARLMGAGRELYGRKKDGTQIPVEIGLNPVQTHQGMIVLGAIVDITARKKSAEELRAVAEELRRSNQELEQFAYAASHDLQEPLRMIAGFIKLLEQQFKGTLDEKTARYITFAVEGAERMSQLINDLLEYSRVARVSKKIESVDLNKAYETAIANLQASIQDNDAAITSDNLPTIKSNSVQMIQLFQNLIGNAIKFRKKDAPPVIHVGCALEQNRWIISFRDNGIGIAPEHLEKIFMIFKRLHSKKEYPGTGIGLAICKKIVEQQHGEIRVESHPGEGSIFHCAFPKS
jgi:PAS domain S-box-containing protein